MAEPTLTKEDRDHIASLVRSPGWAILLKHVLIPRVLHATNQLDVPGADFPQTQLWRGAKQELRHLLQVCYSCADIPDPFKEHYQAFLLSLGVSAPNEQELTSEKAPTAFPERPKPTSFPVL